MKYAVVYDSPTGNTKILAEEIKSCMDGQNGSTEECLYFGEPVPDEGFMEKLSEAEMIFYLSGVTSLPTVCGKS